ncbi:MAG: FAD-dependent oxidoreductase [Planctomycetales bacterium]|nr:FAD-dependent oxidoreductase [Planctomycetales bacterium]
MNQRNFAQHCVLIVFCVLGLQSSAVAQHLLLEAESFESHGGWQLDTQFIDAMGSPYLLAHGLGQPVDDASATVTFPEPGEYRVFVRTKDWVARWNALGQPGRFQVFVNDQPLQETFGTTGVEWFWQDGGTVNIENKQAKITLRDLTGFDGRCDAIYFTKEGKSPPNSSDVLPVWRRAELGLEEQPTLKSGYDLVVVGGGYAGMASALSAARLGCKVALIQNRAVLGGNGSSEVRVWSMGLIRRGKYPRIGEIVEEFCDHATKSPGTFEEFEDDKKEQIVRAEKNIDLFLNHHAYKVESDGKQIRAVYTFDTRTSEQKRFVGKLYADCTGHGTIGHLAKADSEMTAEGRMGMSNMWAWGEGDQEVSFPETPWALDLEMKDFPYPRDHHGQWFWESGFDKDPIGGAEAIRDWNLRAVFGAFNAMKNRDGADKHKTAFLTWVAFIGGPRESRRLMGDVVLTQDDIVTKREFRDGCVPSTWSIDLHYPKKQYAEKYPDNPFISIAVHDRRIDRNYGYPVPYRCFYSRNIENLFMAGRCISVTHQALGTTRVMKTCGMMGEVVGKAASVCVSRDCLPRAVYENHWDDMATLLTLPGKARAESIDAQIVIPDDALPLAGPHGPMTGLDPQKLGGVVVDDVAAEKTGEWKRGTGLEGYVGYGYMYADADSNATARFTIKVPQTATYDIRLAFQPHENRGSQVPVTVTTEDGESQLTINMKDIPPLDNGMVSLGKRDLQEGQQISITVGTAGARGIVHADAVQIVRVDEPK